MLDHISLGTRDLDRATGFYAELLGAIGYRLHRKTADEAAFGPGEDWSFFLYPVDPNRSPIGERMHVAFRVGDRSAAKAFEAAALSLGAHSVREVAEWPQFGADYFGGSVRDPDGHVIEVLTRNAD